MGGISGEMAPLVVFFNPIPLLPPLEARYLQDRLKTTMTFGGIATMLCPCTAS